MWFYGDDIFHLLCSVLGDEVMPSDANHIHIRNDSKTIWMIHVAFFIYILLIIIIDSNVYIYLWMSIYR